MNQFCSSHSNILNCPYYSTSIWTVICCPFDLFLHSFLLVVNVHWFFVIYSPWKKELEWIKIDAPWIHIVVCFYCRWWCLFVNYQYFIIANHHDTFWTTTQFQCFNAMDDGISNHVVTHEKCIARMGKSNPVRKCILTIRPTSFSFLVYRSTNTFFHISVVLNQRIFTTKYFINIARVPHFRIDTKIDWIFILYPSITYNCTH